MVDKIIAGACAIAAEGFLNIRPSSSRGAPIKLFITRGKLACRTQFFVNRATAAYKFFQKPGFTDFPKCFQVHG